MESKSTFLDKRNQRASQLTAASSLELRWMLNKMQEEPSTCPLPDLSPILVELPKVWKDYQRMKAYRVIYFFAILILFGSVAVALLVYYLLTK